jgi:hypothetical protein
MNLRDQIVAAADCVREAVEVPEWNCTVYVRSIIAQDLDSWQAETYVYKEGDVATNLANIRGRLLVRCLVDEAGQRIFADNEAALLGAKSTQVIDRLYKVAQRLNAVTSKDVEELAKNSSPSPDAVSQ